MSKQTKSSFDYQWKYLNDGAFLLSDTSFAPEKFIPDEIGKPAEWFKDKKVIDVGCGSGRWALGFKKLGCDILAVDQSEAGVKTVDDLGINAKQIDLFDINKDELGQFDIVWSWGVLHHTGKTQEAFHIVSDLVKDGGVFHVMIYNKKPRRIKFYRTLFRPFPYGLKTRFIRTMMWFVRRNRRFHYIFPVHPTSVHVNFDALSPAINSEHSENEVKQWFEETEFENIERRYPKWIYKQPVATTDIIMNGYKNWTKSK